MARHKKDVIRCTVCGVRATNYMGNFGHSPLCDNIVCFRTRADEVNKEIIEAFEDVTGGEDVAYRII